MNIGDKAFHFLHGEGIIVRFEGDHCLMRFPDGSLDVWVKTNELHCALKQYVVGKKNRNSNLIYTTDTTYFDYTKAEQAAKELIYKSEGLETLVLEVKKVFSFSQLEERSKL